MNWLYKLPVPVLVFLLVDFIVVMLIMFRVAVAYFLAWSP